MGQEYLHRQEEMKDDEKENIIEVLHPSKKSEKQLCCISLPVSYVKAFFSSISGKTLRRLW